MNLNTKNHSIDLDRTFQNELRNLAKVTTNTTLLNFLEKFEQIDFEITHHQYSLDTINTLSQNKEKKEHFAEHFQDFIVSRDSNINLFKDEFKNLLASNALSPENDFGISSHVNQIFNQRIQKYETWQSQTNTNILQHTPKEVLKLKLLDKIALKLFTPQNKNKLTN